MKVRLENDEVRVIKEVISEFDRNAEIYEKPLCQRSLFQKGDTAHGVSR